MTAAPETAGLDERRAELPGGRHLEMRPEGPACLDGILALYDGLDEDELYCRFFSHRRPPLPFMERMTHVWDRGGVGMVAVLVERPGLESIVGEASYELLDNGDGEIGITVDRRLRGWLGPWLLDALVSEARKRGVRNLQAEVLVANRRMLALLHSRGFVILDRYFSPATIRLAIAVIDETPVWSDNHDRLRVIVEAAGGSWIQSEALEREGLRTAICPGRSSGGPECPALLGRIRPMVAEADVLVFNMPADEMPGQALVAAHRQLHGSTPMCLGPAVTDLSAAGLRRLPASGDAAGVAALLRELVEANR